jgi:hypothetical protein
MTDFQRLDVVQIAPEHDERFGGCFMMVTKLTADGPMGFVEVPGEGRAYYVCPAKMCIKIGVAEWVPPDELEEKTDIPFIGFSGERLAKLPDVKIGDSVECLECGQEHILEEGPAGNPWVLFYRCGDKTKMGAINNKLIVGVKPSLEG